MYLFANVFTILLVVVDLLLKAAQQTTQLVFRLHVAFFPIWNSTVYTHTAYNVKKSRFIHELTANDTSKTAKITKKGDITDQHIACHWHVLLSNITSPVVIFAVLDVTSAVNSCINRGFLHLCLQFYYISAAVAWCRLHGTWSTKFLRCSCRPASPYTKFGTKAVIATYTPNPRCVPNLKLLPSMVAKISRGSHFLGCCP